MSTQAHQLQRYKKNDEWERFRLQNEGNSYFKMKVVCLRVADPSFFPCRIFAMCYTNIAITPLDLAEGAQITKNLKTEV